MHTEPDIDILLTKIIQEDLGPKGDITSSLCIQSDTVAKGTFHFKQKGIVAGLHLLTPFFQKVNPNLNVKLLVDEGSFQKAGTAIAEVEGPAQSILSGERSALNLLQHLSGIATITSQYVHAVTGLPCAIFDTRRTSPGLRTLEKYAVRLGGGQNHRLSLSDRFIIKANHLAFMQSDKKQAIIDVVNQARTLYPSTTLEIETPTLELFKLALQTPIDAIMLIGMTPSDVEYCVQAGHKAGKKVYFESSVSLPKDSVLAYAKTGIDGISIGELTAAQLGHEISMRLSPCQDASASIAEHGYIKGLFRHFFKKKS